VGEALAVGVSLGVSAGVGVALGVGEAGGFGLAELGIGRCEVGVVIATDVQPASMAAVARSATSRILRPRVIVRA